MYSGVIADPLARPTCCLRGEVDRTTACIRLTARGRGRDGDQVPGVQRGHGVLRIVRAVGSQAGPVAEVRRAGRSRLRNGPGRPVRDVT